MRAEDGSQNTEFRIQKSELRDRRQKYKAEFLRTRFLVREVNRCNYLKNIL